MIDTSIVRFSGVVHATETQVGIYGVRSRLEATVRAGASGPISLTASRCAIRTVISIAQQIVDLQQV